MLARLPCGCMAGPGFSAQQLNRYQIALIHPFNFDGDVDQTIGLHHGGQYPGSLCTGRSNLENPFFSSEYTTQKMAPVRPF